MNTKDTPKETWEERFNELNGMNMCCDCGEDHETYRHFIAEELAHAKAEAVGEFLPQLKEYYNLKMYPELTLAQAKADGAREVIGRQPMKYNKSTLVTNQFIASCKNGERPIFESMDYVAISRKQWDEIKKRLATLREDYKEKV